MCLSMKFTEHSMLRFLKKESFAKSLLHVIANKTPTWISWKGYPCNWCGVRELHLLFIWVLIYCLDFAKHRHSVVYRVHRTWIVTTSYGKESQLQCQFFFSTVLGEWLSTNDVECCIFSLIYFFFFQLHLVSRPVLDWLSFSCVLYKWQVCFFP